jgi:hypothetical protein
VAGHHLLDLLLAQELSKLTNCPRRRAAQMKTADDGVYLLDAGDLLAVANGIDQSAMSAAADND